MARSTISLDSREKLALVLVALMLGVLALGLGRLQIVEHAELAQQSESNRIRVQPIIARRGIVYDREGRIVMDNRPSFTASIVAAGMKKDTTIRNLARVLGMDTTEVLKYFRRNLISRYQPTPVKRDVPFDVVAVIEEQAERFPGVAIQMEEVRRYTDSLGAECFTGFVGEVSAEELQRSERTDYRLGSMIGKKGLEKQYDDILRGQEGTEYIEVTSSGQALGAYQGKRSEPAVAGVDLWLSVDIDLQKVCVATLDTFCCGAIVAMDPRNGEILAMTSYPGYDANIFSSVIPDTMWQRISTDSTHPLLNRPLSGLYPPGSTVKFIAVGGALDEGLITENTVLKPCYGGYQFGNRYFRCWLPHGHGRLTAVHAIEQSCDVFLYQLGEKLGVDELSRYYGLCGFGRSTGADVPSEVPGLNPNTKYYDERYGRGQWSRGLVLNNAIGQGELLVTPLQLCQFFCGLANRGPVYRPHLVKRTEFPDGKVVTTATQLSFRLPFSESTMDLLREGLRLVVEGERGTARSLRNPRYSVGGKTGTAQNPHGNEHSWFCGVAPLEAPEIVVCAIVENAGHGSEVAAPTVGRVISAYMEKRAQRDALQLTYREESD